MARTWDCGSRRVFPACGLRKLPVAEQDGARRPADRAARIRRRLERPGPG